MTKDQLNHHLTGFLKRNRCLGKFKEGVKIGMTKTTEALLKYYQNDPQKLILGSFTWISTEQGQKFWVDIDKKWKEYINEIL